MKLNKIETDNLRRFKNIDYNFFIHPLDRDALETLKQIPVLDIVIKKFLEYGYEKFTYIQNIADNVRLGPNQCSRLYEMLTTACDILDMNVPEIYISQTPVPNAMTSGVNKPYIVINSGMIELLEDEELFAVIAHELGHIKCNHVLYRTLAVYLMQIITAIGQSTFGLGRFLGSGFIMLLLEWYRKSELSADRVALMAIQDADVIVSLNMKLAGGSKSLYKELNREEFLNQTNDYYELDKDTLSSIYKVLTIANLTHPHCVLRAKDSFEWSKSIEFSKAMDGDYPRKGSICHNCNVSINENMAFCPHCGVKFKKESDICSNCQKKIPEACNFCPYCGNKTT